MLEISLCLAGAALALFLLPVPLRMRIDRPFPGRTVAMRAEASLLAGLVGVAVTGPGDWRWGPTLGRRSLGGISFPLRARKRKAGVPKEPLSGQGPQGKKETEVEPAPERKSPQKERARSRRLRQAAMQPGLGLLRRLPRSFHLSRLLVRGRVGLGDPAKTGYLYGVVQGLEGILPQRRKQFHIRLEPDFQEQVCCGRFEICLNLSPFRLAASVLRFGLEMASRRLSDSLRPRSPRQEKAS